MSNSSLILRLLRPAQTCVASTAQPFLASWQPWQPCFLLLLQQRWVTKVLRNQIKRRRRKGGGHNTLEEVTWRHVRRQLAGDWLSTLEKLDKLLSLKRSLTLSTTTTSFYVSITTRATGMEDRFPSIAGADDLSTSLPCPNIMHRILSSVINSSKHF